MSTVIEYKTYFTF